MLASNDLTGAVQRNTAVNSGAAADCTTSRIAVEVKRIEGMIARLPVAHLERGLSRDLSGGMRQRRRWHGSAAGGDPSPR